MNDKELTFQALHQLQHHTGLVAKVAAYGYPDKPNSSDAHIEFDNSNAKLIARLVRWSDQKDAESIIEEVCQAANEYSNGSAKVVVSDYINQELGERLRAANVNYIDRIGNAYLDLPPTFILIEGKLPKQTSQYSRTAKLFTETGMKVICALLTNDNLLNANYRTVADHAGVSMGTIGWVLRELRDQNFTSEEYRSRTWKNKIKLIETWVSEYPTLSVKHHLCTRYTLNSQWWKTLDVTEYGGLLGGELASLEQLGRTDVKPREGLIYVDKSEYRRLVKDMRLVLAEHVSNDSFIKVEVRSKYWGLTGQSDLLSSSTHPFITYADLMETWDPSNIELAKQISAKYFTNNDLV